MRFLIFILPSIWLNASSLHAQILNADRYNVAVDSLKPFKALVDLGFSLNKQNTLLFSFDTKLDLSYSKPQNLWVLAGQFKLFRSGSRNLLNGGFAHARSRFFRQHWVHPEFFAQAQLDDVRGMELRLLAGGNARFVLKDYDKGHFHFGLGLFYELERWSYSGVPSERRPATTTPKINHFVKVNSYLSLTQTFRKLIVLQLTAYWQFRPDSFVRYPRLSADGRLSILLSKHLQFTVQYNVFYDSLPVVPIDRLYFSVVNKLTFTF